MLNNEQLLGIWHVDTKDVFGDVTLEFSSDGTLRYVVREKEKSQIMNLTYRIDGDYLITDQPSSPKIEKTKAKITGDKLVLNYNGKEVYYTRDDSKA